MAQQISRADFQKRKEKKSDKDKQIIEVTSKDQFAKALTSQGVQKQTFNIPSYVLDESVASFTSEVEGLKPQSISKQDQLEMITEILANPFHAPYICCISGKPNDLRAKLLATYIMRIAIEKQIKKEVSEKTLKYLNDKSLPIYSSVMGWSSNVLLDQKEKPSLLILGNVPQGMTNHKQERLRDLLETYSGIPRIVVTANHDPLTFFNGSLFMHLNACCFLTSSVVKKSFEV